MLLTEEHKIHISGHRRLFREIDDFCYRAKNLYNATNYVIRQCYHIHEKICSNNPLEDKEREMLENVNEGIRLYNAGRSETKQLSCVDEKNGYMADMYFLSWYQKSAKEYKAMPYATCSQIIIQELCRAWKSFYMALSAYKKNPKAFTGFPKRPDYLDKKEGRCWLVLTNQNFRVEENCTVRMPGFLKEIHVTARHRDVRQIRIKTEKDCIRILLIYEQEEASAQIGERKTVMGIDLGIDNLMTIVWGSDEAPVILNGKLLKSMNRYYNQKRALLQSQARRDNGKDTTRRIRRLTEKRNRKVRDYIHKASRKVIDLAERTGARLIVIGYNSGWKQEVNLGKATNQNFVSIPYRMLIDMIRYKAALAGIEVLVTQEAYTSGTSYLDGEMPEKEFCRKERRIHRGLFRSNTGLCINADVNAAYQILKAGGITDLIIKTEEPVRRMLVA